MSVRAGVHVLAASVAGLVVTWILAGWTSALLVDENGRGPRWMALPVVFQAVLAVAPIGGGIVAGLLLRSAPRTLVSGGVAAVLFGALLGLRFYGWGAPMSWEGLVGQSLTIVAAALALFFSAGFSRNGRRHAC